MKALFFFVLLVGLLMVVPASSAWAQSPSGSIEGQIVDADSEDPLPGVNVVIVGSMQGAATDIDGRYRIAGLEEGVYDVQATFIGYATQVIEGVQVTPNEATTVNFELAPSTSELDEVLVVGYGTQRKSDLTGSVASIDGAAAEQMPVSSVDQAIQGRAPGVYVKQTSAGPGGGTSIRIRGTNSINSGSEPLYVIDGFPVYPDNNSAGTGSSRPPTNVLATLSLGEIESIEVLKDASATAIYGSRGANGVILITTKRGASGQTRVRYQGSHSLQQVANTIETMSAGNYARYMNMLEESQGGGALYSQEEIQSMGAGTDWLEEILRTGSVANHRLSISGGSDGTQYAVMGNYHRNEGILLNTNFERYGMRLNLDSELLGGIAELQNSWSFSRTESNNALTSQGGPGGIIITALGLDPTVPVRTGTGEYDYALYDGRFLINPVAELRQGVDRDRGNRLFGNSALTVHLTEGLDFRTSFGADIFNNNRETFYPEATYQGRQRNISLTHAERSITDLLNENILSYTRQLTENHFIDAVAGYTWQKQVNRFSSVEAREFPADDFSGVNLQNGTNPQIPFSDRQEWTLQSLLARVNYNYGDRYLVTLTIRRDGSSKFGAENKYATFPSAALGWRIDQEPFFNRFGFSDAVSNLKLRASYGLTGNSEIAVYRSLSGLNTSNYVFGGQLVGGLAENRIPNPDLRWESTLMRNVGLDVGLFAGQLDLTFDYFNNRTDDLLLNVSIPSSLGFSSILMNSGSMGNKGFEASADFLVLSTNTVNWSIGGNVSVVRNKILDLGGSQPFFAGGGGHLGVYGSWVEEGLPLGVWRGFDYIGIFQSEEQIQNNASRPGDQPGYPMYRDLNGDGEITEPEDFLIIGDPNPDFTWGLNTALNLGNFDLSVFLRGVHGNDVRNLQASEMGDGVQKINQLAGIIEDSWSPDNKDASRPIIDGNRDFANSYRDSDYFIEDGSFIRLQNVAMGYQLPESVRTEHIRNVRLYVSAQNVLTFTDYSGFDPEVSSNGQSNLNRGDDYDAYPRSRTFTFGIDIGF